MLMYSSVPVSQRGMQQHLLRQRHVFPSHPAAARPSHVCAFDHKDAQFIRSQLPTTTTRSSNIHSTSSSRLSPACAPLHSFSLHTSRTYTASQSLTTRTHSFALTLNTSSIFPAASPLPCRSFSSVGGGGGGLWGYPSLLTYTAWENAKKKLVRFNEIGEKLNTATGMHHQEIARLSKEHHALSAVAALVEEIEALRKELRDLQLLSRGTDAEMATLAKEEMEDVIKRAMEKEETIVQYLLPDAQDDLRDAILEVRAGTGGEEAALWAKDMFHMYEGYAQRKGWSFKILEISSAEHGGYKEASASISGTNVFGFLKHEAGVHRVQRIPTTDANGRVHTSAATVAIMPEAEEVDVSINESKDLRIDVYRAGGAGGQHVNKTESAVRITHLPTGTIVCMQDERSQIANRIKAMQILRSRLYEAARQAEQARRAAMRSEQVGSGDRSERIRTYNFSQSRITDHRINLNKFGMENMLSGELLEDFIDELLRNDRRVQLQNI